MGRWGDTEAGFQGGQTPCGVFTALLGPLDRPHPQEAFPLASPSESV